jgi:predicted transcriptional regulator
MISGVSDMEGEGYKDHRTRMLLYEYISENPGPTFKVLKSAFKLTDGTLRYHLGYLQKRRRIVQEKKGREKCYFSYLRKKFPFTDPSLHLNKSQEFLLELVSRYPGISFKDLKRRSGMDRASFDYNLKKLKRSKLIWKIDRNGSKGYEIVTKERLADEMFLALVNKYLDGEIGKDDMMEILRKLRSYREEE